MQLFRVQSLQYAPQCKQQHQREPGTCLHVQQNQQHAKSVEIVPARGPLAVRNVLPVFERAYHRYR